MSIDEKDLDLSRLAAEHLLGTIGENEKKEFELWLSEDETHRQWFARMGDPEFRACVRRDLAAVDVARGWRSVNRKLSGDRRGLRRRVRYISAAAAVAALILAGYFHYLRDPQPVLPTEQETFRAILVLADGTQVEIGPGHARTIPDGRGNEIITDGERLDYTQTCPATPEPIYHELIVPKGGQHKIVLPDGSAVHLNADSRLRYPMNFPPGERHVELSGEAYFTVARDEAAPFTVSAGDLEVTVLGTEFNVSSYLSAGAAMVALVNGSVEVQAGPTGERAGLTPGYEARLDRKSNRMSVEPVDLSYATAWRTGLLRFRDRPLSEIMDIVSRWYDVEVAYGDDAIRDYRFGCNIDRYTTQLDDLLQVFTETGKISVTRKEGSIYISRNR